MLSTYDLESIEELVEQSPVLYHYTTIDGLWGILDASQQENGFKNVLWATHYQHLNDLKELMLFRDILFERLVPELAQRLKVLEDMNIPELEQEFRKFTTHLEMAAFQANAHLDSLYRSNASYGPFITSFCALPADVDEQNNSLLSQWRGYGKNGGAIIVFDTEVLSKCLKKDWELYDVIWGAGEVFYKNTYGELPEKLQCNINTIADVFLKFYPKVVERTINYNEDCFTEAVAAFYVSVWRIKHKSFFEEQEIRLVAFPTIFDEERIEWGRKHGNTQSEKQVYFRKKESELIPYIKLPLLNDGQLPIKKIIIGPHPSQDARAATAHAIVAKHGIPVTKSEIPLRW